MRWSLITSNVKSFAESGIIFDRNVYKSTTLMRMWSSYKINDSTSATFKVSHRLNAKEYYTSYILGCVGYFDVEEKISYNNIMLLK